MKESDLPVVMKNYIDKFIDEIREISPIRVSPMFRVRFETWAIFEYFDEYMNDDIEDGPILSYINNYMAKYGNTTKNYIAGVTGITY